MKINSVLIAPILTEKGTARVASGVYPFQVSRNANKAQIARACESIYGVTVGKVSIINRKGKKKRAGKKMISRQLPSKKIALITVKIGRIDVFPQA